MPQVTGASPSARTIKSKFNAAARHEPRPAWRATQHARNAALVRLSNEALTKLIQTSGRQDAIEELLTRLDPQLRGFVLSRVGASAADDVLQEVRIAIITGISRQDAQRGSVRSWAIRIAHNKIIDVYRRGRPEVSLEERQSTSWEPAVGDEAIQRAIEQPAMRRAVARAIAGLTPARREVVWLRYYEDLSYAEIASLLGKTEGTIKTELNRALNSVREQGALEDFVHAA